jgi:hypothetical protein
MPSITRLRLREVLSAARPSANPTALPARRRSARRAVVFGLIAFGLATAALAFAAETVRPEWRDPEYGHRLRQVRRWQRARPDRPLVLVLGSSRAQQGVSPKAMGFPDEPDSPVVYNLGYRGATPVIVWLQLARALDDGARPRGVVVMLAGAELRAFSPVEEQVRPRLPQLSPADLRRLAAFTGEPRALHREVLDAPRWAWSTGASGIQGELLPQWRPPSPHDEVHRTAWTRMDEHGFSPLPTEFLPRWRDQERQNLLAFQALALNNPLGDVSVRAIHAMIARCRAEGIAIAFCWAPESPESRAAYPAQGRAFDTAFAESLTSRFGAPVFAAPTDLEEGEFSDTIHLDARAAEKYSRWLADNCLRPWLAQSLK